MSKNQKLSDVENLFSGLADKTRLRLLNLMRSGEVCVNIFTEILNESQPKISRHLAYLRNSGIVETRRDGKQIYYRITNIEDKFIEEILQSVFNFLDSQTQMQQDILNFSTKYSSASSITKLPQNIFRTNKYDYPYTSSKKTELDVFLL